MSSDRQARTNNNHRDYQAEQDEIALGDQGLSFAVRRELRRLREKQRERAARRGVVESENFEDSKPRTKERKNRGDRRGSSGPLSLHRRGSG